MDRRGAMWTIMAALLGGCGGGGGAGGDGSSATIAGNPAATNAALSPNIACWGDSLTPPFAENLRMLVPGRALYDGGFYGQTSTFITAQQLADNSMTGWINVFWEGHNNVTQPEAVKADIATGVAHLAPGNGHFIVLSLLNNAWTAPRGTPGYDTVMQLNAALAARYPDNYLDVRSWLVAHFDPSNPQDVIDNANDVVPSSLRYDDIHMQNAGSVLVAQRVKQFIDTKGW